MVRIRFGTFSFDRVTRLLKANLVDKLSHFGGTAGLFTGGSFFSVFEFLPLFMTLLIMLFQFFTNKNKKLKTIQVEESKAKENEKNKFGVEFHKNEDIDEKINDIARKFASFQRDFNQTLRGLEKEIKKKVDVHLMEKTIEKKIDQQFTNNLLDKYGPNP